MKLEALILVARIFCPWQPPDPLPSTVILPRAAYEELEQKHGLNRTGGFTTWREVFTGVLTDVRIYLREGSDARLLCHEWGHAVEGHWHP